MIYFNMSWIIPISTVLTLFRTPALKEPSATLPGTPTVTAAASSTYLSRSKLRWSLRPPRFAHVSSVINIITEDNKKWGFLRRAPPLRRLALPNQKSFLYHFPKYFFIAKYGLKKILRPLSSEEMQFVWDNLNSKNSYKQSSCSQKLPTNRDCSHGDVPAAPGDIIRYEIPRLE